MSDVRGHAVSTSAGHSFSLEDLQALNAEILALIQAGVPLELGLRSVAADEETALQKLTAEIALRLEQGDTLSEALEAQGSRLPRQYRHLIEAGLQVNRLPAALEALSDLIEEMIQLRRSIRMALLYPLIVVSLGYVVFMGFLIQIVDVYRNTYQVFRLQMTGVVGLLIALRDSWELWCWAPPLMMCLAGYWWYRQGRSRNLDAADRLQGINWLPGVGRILRYHRQAQFARLLAAMVEQKLGLDRAVLLAADCVGGRHLQASAQELAVRIQQGSEPGQDGPAGARASLPGLPPLLTWLMLGRSTSEQLPEKLRHAADLYHRRACDLSEAMRLIMPVIASLGIGGGVTALYVMSMYIPVIELIAGLSK